MAASASTAFDMDEEIRMWALTLPLDTPGQRKDSKARESKVRVFHDWKRQRLAARYAVNAVSRIDCAEYFVFCKTLTTKRGTTPAPRYIENHFLVLAGFSDWAQASGYYPKDDNPARGHAQVSKKARARRAKTHGWQPFSSAQLTKIFNPETYKSLRNDSARWLPLMALYTGARSNELAHREIEDCFDAMGQPVFDFNFLGPHKSLKTDASERKTPVHPDLIALGLWERVARLRATGEVKLFPGLEFSLRTVPPMQRKALSIDIWTGLELQRAAPARWACIVFAIPP
jgi:integrase